MKNFYNKQKNNAAKKYGIAGAAFVGVALVAFMSSLIGILILSVWLIIQNYEYCTLPFQQECWKPDNVYYDDPIRDQEILSLAKHMELTRNNLSNRGAEDFIGYYEEVPIYNSESIQKIDSKTYFPNGSKRAEAAGKEKKTEEEKSEDTKKVGEKVEKKEDEASVKSGTMYQINVFPKDKETLRNMMSSTISKTTIANKVDELIDAGIAENIDPRFLLSIFIQETGWGNSKVVKSHNNTGGIKCWGEKPEFNMTCPAYNGEFRYGKFATVGDSFRYQADFLKRLYVNEGLVTVPQVASKYTEDKVHWVPNTGSFLRKLGVTEEIGSGVTGVVDSGSSQGAQPPNLDMYERLQVYFTPVGEDSNGDTVYQQRNIKEIDSGLKKQMKKWFNTATNEEDWTNAFLKPIKAYTTESEMHLRSLIQMDMEGTLGMDEIAYETAHAFLRAGRGMGVIKSGDGDASQTENSGGKVVDTSESPESSGKVLTVEATAYIPDCGAGCTGITATGIDARVKPTPRVIAVDPSVIPLGTYVHVQGYGVAIAGDTGGRIKGNIIDVLVSDIETAKNWGRKKNVKVTILDGKPEGIDSAIGTIQGSGHDAVGDSGYAKVKISTHKKAFVKWVKDTGYVDGIEYKDDDELIRKLLITGKVEKNILLEAATDELVYPFLVYQMKELPTDKDGEKIKEVFNELMEEEALTEDMLSTLTLGHYMKRNAFTEFEKAYSDDLGIFSFNKDGATEAFEKYVGKEKAKAEDPDYEEKLNKGNKNMSFFGKVGSQLKGFITAPENWMTGTYMDMKVKGDTFIRFAIFNSTQDLMEIGAYTRTLCFYTEPYGNEEFAEGEIKSFLGKAGNAISETVGAIIPGNWFDDENNVSPTEDFCIRVNKMAYGDGKMEWETSQVLDKVKKNYTLNFKCEQLPEAVLNEKRKEAEAALKALESLKEAGLVEDKNYEKKMDDLYSLNQSANSMDKTTGKSLLGQVVAAASNVGEFAVEDNLKPRSPYNILKIYDYPDLLDDIEESYNQKEAINLYSDIFNKFRFDGEVGLDKNGVTVGKVQKSGTSYDIEWISFDKNTKYILSIGGEIDCSKYVDPDYGFKTHELKHTYKTTTETYYKTPWDAFKMAQNFNLYSTGFTKTSETELAKKFKEESLEKFFAVLNVDYSKNTEWKTQFGEWLTGRMAAGAPVDEGTSGGGGSQILEPKDYAGIEFQPPIPYSSGQKIIITSGFGQRWGKLHTGIDLVGPGGTVTNILAAADGVVSTSRFSDSWGEMIQIKHQGENGVFYSHYAHMVSGSRQFKVGDTVKRGDVIGKMGKTGSTDALHLHFNIYKDGLTNGNLVDPTNVIGLTPANATCNASASNCRGKHGM